VVSVTDPHGRILCFSRPCEMPNACINEIAVDSPRSYS
jgi:hypothetical protein